MVQYLTPRISHCHIQDEYLLADSDPNNHTQWFHYHLQKCYTPYMDAVGCLYSVTDKEVQKMKREAGPEGWKQLEATFIADTAKSVGENKARMMWELSTNLKEIHETTRQRDGHLFGEQPKPGTHAGNTTQQQQQQQQQQPRNLAEAMGVSKYTNKQTPVANKRSHLEVEDMFATAKREELKEKMMEAKKEQQSKSFWKFGL